MRKGKLEEAMKTLQKLRGSSYRGVEEEVAAILHHLIIPASYTIFTDTLCRLILVLFSLNPNYCLIAGISDLLKLKRLI